MLNINPEIICAMLPKMREFHAKEGMDLNEGKSFQYQESDFDFQILEDDEHDLTYNELEKTISDLEPDQQAALVALMWIGRGDYTKEEWNAAYKEALRNLSPRTAEYLLTKPLIADYLEEALRLFGYSCEE